MVHIAIMKKSWGLTQKILSGEKTIETRWYKHKSKPWDCINKEETIYFKDSGEPVTAKATISKIEQFENLDSRKRNNLLKKYSQKDLGTTRITNEIAEYVDNKKYAIIIHLKNPKAIKPFNIDKTDFGMMSAWLCVDDLSEIIVKDGIDEIKGIRKNLLLSSFETGKVEYTSGNYDENGLLIKGKIPTVTSEFGEIGIINKKFYFVMIFHKNLLSKQFLDELGKIRKCNLYGYKEFLKDLTIEEILGDKLGEKYIQVQYDCIDSDQMKVIIDIHNKLKDIFEKYRIFPINQLKVSMKNYA